MSDEQNTLQVMDDKSRIATVRLGDAFGDTTPPVKYVLEDHLGNSTAPFMNLLEKSVPYKEHQE